LWSCWRVSLCMHSSRSASLRVVASKTTASAEWDSGACWGGQLEVLKWLRANGCPWDKQTCYIAAHGGHLEVLKRARANGCEWSPAEHAVDEVERHSKATSGS